jgi:SAM-dependent methyltransferase
MKSVGGAVAFHFMEHLAKDDAIKMIQEVERVLAPGGVFNMVTPYWMSEMAYQDLDHKTFWTENTFRNLFNNPYYDGTMPRNWKFKVQTCLIMGVVHRNLALVTQLVKS